MGRMNYCIWLYCKCFSFLRQRTSWPRGKKGAVIVEYVLLLVTCVGLAMVLKEVIQLGSDEDSSGWLINMWLALLNEIAEDM